MGGCDFFTLLACTSVFLATVACHTCTLTGALHLYAICQFIMIIEHASVVKTTNDRAATWRFVEMDGTFAVIGDNRKIIPCDNIDHMRSVYKRFIGRKYGFLPVK
jgi:small-conductance mechanosensitive channel